MSDLSFRKSKWPLALLAFAGIGVAIHWSSSDARIATPSVRPKENKVQISNPLALKSEVPIAVNNLSLPVRTFIDKKKSDSARITPSITEEIPSPSLHEIHALRSVLFDKTESDVIRNEAINILLRSKDYRVIGDLVALLGDEKSPRFRSFLAQHIGTACRIDGNNESIECLFPLLEDIDIEVQREALLALTRLRHPTSYKTCVKWLNDPAKRNCVDLVIRCVKELDMRDQLEKIREYLHSDDEVILIAAISTLSEWNDKASSEAFEKAANSSSPRSRRAGEAALRRIGADMRKL